MGTYPIWKRLWLLLSIIWVIVSGLNAATILAFSEETDKVWRPVALGVAVPALAYLVGWAWERWRSAR